MMTTYYVGLCVLLVMGVLDGPGHQESTAGPITVPLSPPIAAQKIIRASKTARTHVGLTRAARVDKFNLLCHTVAVREA